MTSSFEAVSRETQPTTSSAVDISAEADLRGHQDLQVPGSNKTEELVRICNGDIVIVVLGASGSGKSTLINTIAGCEVAPVGAHLTSCTQQVRAYRCKHPTEDRAVVLVDTPGLDDSDRTDYDVLTGITDWLNSLYIDKILLSGILHLHNIAERKMRGPQVRNLGSIFAICGTEPLKNLVMLTTFWDIVAPEVGAARETELVEIFWTDFIPNQSRVRRFTPNSTECAWSIVDLFSTGARYPQVPLQIQTEMVDQHKEFHETSLFSFLVNWWAKILATIWGVRQNDSARSSLLPSSINKLKLPWRARLDDSLATSSTSHDSVDEARAINQKASLEKAIPASKRKEESKRKRRRAAWSVLTWF